MIYWLLWWYGSERDLNSLTLSKEDADEMNIGDVGASMYNDQLIYFLVKDYEVIDEDIVELHVSTVNNFGVILVSISKLINNFKFWIISKLT